MAPYLVRLAGFSFARLEALRCIPATEAEAALARATTAREGAGLALDAALGAERYAGNPAFDDPAARKVLSKHVKHARAFARRLADGNVPAESLGEVTRVVPNVAPLVEELARAHAAWLEARAGYAQTFAADFEAARGAIRAFFGDPRIQESVFLESPEAFERIQQLIASAGPRNARARQRERLGALYAQRFCAKNDSNSICGPHGVAYLGAASAAAPAIEILVEDARRQTYYSFWAAERLLDVALQRNADLVTYRRHPSAHLDGAIASWCVMEHDATTSFRRRYRRSELPPVGVQLVTELAAPRSLAALHALAAAHELEVADLADYLEQLVDAGLVVRGPGLPPGLFEPLRAVAAIIPDGDPMRSEIAETERLVTTFAKGALATRVDALGELRKRFVDATGDAATRGEGQHYADRSLLHEDGYVQLHAEIGAARAEMERVLPVLFAILELSLELARERVREWFRARFGEGVRVAALEAHRAFDEDRVLETAATTPRAAALRLAIERVRDVFARAAAAPGPVTVAPEALEAALSGVELPAHPSYVSIDVMLRRDAREHAIVLGEVHGFFWFPTCLLDVLPEEHRERTVAAMRAAVSEMSRGVTTAECVFLHTQATDRRFALATTDLQLMVPSDRPGAIDLGALELRLTGDVIEFSHGDAEIVPLLAYNEYPFILYTSRIAPAFDSFAERFFPDSLLPDSLREGDAPRLAIGDVVVRRRSWRRSVASVREALAATDEAELFRRAQVLRRELGCDACVFVSVAGEPKPVLLDFSNMFLVEALVNMLERAPADSVVKLGEMLPGPDELVARGPDGTRTCELRMGFYRT